MYRSGGVIGEGIYLSDSIGGRVSWWYRCVGVILVLLYSWWYSSDSTCNRYKW